MEADGVTAGGAPVPAGKVLDARMAMALSVHTCPGVYAVMLGAGISLAAGVKTGWDIVTDLVAKVATLHNPGDPEAVEAAVSDPETWWQEQFGTPLGYSSLLAEVAPSPAARQAVLAGYFEPGQDEEAGKVPTAAHRAIAQLVKNGTIRVILTTNFDRLMERALEEVGVSPQVIREHQIGAMKPLAHSQITIIKLHGDYADLEQRNTVDELEEYPPAQHKLLELVLNDYGLIVCGWSADWDKALVKAMEAARTRYPMFWGQVGRMSDAARGLTVQHGASVIDGATADDLFTDLADRVQALDGMKTAPITRDTAVAQLKRFLPDPVQRIKVRDMVEQAVTRVMEASTQAARPLYGPPELFEASLRGYRADSDVLLHLLANGVFHDDGTYDPLFRRVIERLSRLRTAFSGTFSEELDNLRHCPALLATWAIGVASVLNRREQFLAHILTKPTWTPYYGGAKKQTTDHFLNPLRVIHGGALDPLFRSPNGNPYKYPQSRWLRDQLRDAFRLVEPDDTAYEAACSRFEFLASMVALDNTENPLASPWSGEFLLGSVWGYDAGNGLVADIEQELAGPWPMLEGRAFGGDPERARRALERLNEFRIKHPRW
ncbi:SIR2 family protein [Streptomyces prunicolor]|uniref:SIR2 family protein n=1 Tax=Streptomyces prunicolor TaxID=67348 RepID=A0ABU4FQ30_9ACTN|nr:SIR2 family protein [Streptomyces prunicolor]MDV7222639.1 SIR2 family protein [Streptomyces prunicolor]